ncbi:DNA primase [Salipiger bermudensis]|uniref:DNA primase n=1 Tax=Salipiger bermudensis (strain DSM 26914 / JCM 13377 / KCTC 12554 / HTCC2601) TaxID=314265 RepID=Q0FNM6_SALBH|nr:DNA primase [Salipiger bermudensis]EAU45718.1 DNA primase [Salipiger bermudensis HTCC2601]MBR9890968.1 DNA primase [bacterium]MCA1287373.1 DNA primase [Salipiger bermudensis]
MSLPPGFLDELRNRTSLVQVVGRKVMWDNRKSNQAKGDMWAPCPFHQEKSASFHVDDRKGFYYCFGCHAKGDAISFVRESENVEFMEAIEILAREAGMPMPARDPQAAKKADRREQLSEVMEQAVRFFRMQLRAGAATEARAYLDRRGLKEDVRDRFEIGFAPEGWQNLWDHLRGQGVAEDLILGAGLAKASDRGKAPYDVFRNRIMFPIRDARGRAIAFGGRAMDPRDNAKYLNSPETELFDKGRNLYNHAPAREAAGKGQPLIVAEGYMDVIALSEAGFGASVAPLGTAVTETQMQLLWRITDEPIVALDGDKAGLRAAYRVIDLALPLLQAGKTLRFALMPEGKDPDDLLRAEGAGAVSKVLEGAMPMVQLLWRRETEGKVFDSPERKAALDARLRDVLRQIQDPGLRRHYGDEIKELRFQLFRPQRPKRAFGGGGAGGPRRAWNAPAPPSASVKSSLLVAAGDTAENELREAVILAVLLSTPELIAEFEQGLEMLNCTDPVRASLRDVLLRNNADSAAALREEAEYRIGPEPLENLLAARHVAVVPCVRRPGDIELARMTVAEELSKITARSGAAAEIAEAEEDLEHLADEALTWRLAQAAKARNEAVLRKDEGEMDYDFGPNGARLDKDERDAFKALTEQIRFSKHGN